MNNYDARNITDGKIALKQDKKSNGNDTGEFHLPSSNGVLRSLKPTLPVEIQISGASHYNIKLADSFLQQSYTKIETNSLFDSFYSTGAISKAFLNNSGQDVFSVV